MSKKHTRSTQEVASKVIEAHRHGAPIDLEYDEVTGLLEVVLARAKQVTDDSVRKVHEAKQILEAHSSSPGLRRVV
jgi:hypothetical protein